jgi:hypothetical protein
LLVTQLVQTTLLLEDSLAVIQVALTSLPILAITFGTLLLFELPVALLAPVVVVTIAIPIAVAVTVALPLPAL